MPHVNAIAVSIVALSCPPGCRWRTSPCYTPQPAPPRPGKAVAGADADRGHRHGGGRGLRVS